MLLFRTLLPGALLFSFLLVAPASSAQSSTAVAEALFSEGQRLLEAGDTTAACPKFAESQRLDPGTGTLLNLATCYEKAGLTASAWATWKEAAASARAGGQGERETFARGRARDLEAKLAKLTVSVPESSRVEGLTVQRADEGLASATWGTPLPIDAGTHTITASAPGYESFSTEISLADTETKVVEIPALVKLPEEAVDPNAVVLAPAGATSGPQEDSASNGTQKLIGYIVGGAGIVGIGLGTYFGINAISKNNESMDHCDLVDPNQCNQTGVDLRNDAKSSGTIASVAIGVGAAALAGGVVLVLTAPDSSTQIAAMPTHDGGALFVRGTF